jgi:hypothetical protein
MVTWTGQGWLGALFVGLAFFGSYKLFGSTNYVEHPLAALVVLAGSAIPTFVAGKILNRHLPPRFVDNGKDWSSEGHTLCFIRLEWSWVVVLLPLLLLLLHNLGVIS